MYPRERSGTPGRSGPSSHNCSSLCWVREDLLAVFAAFAVVLELDLYLLPVEGTLIISALFNNYALTHSSADARSFISIKAKQYSEFRLRLATMFATVPYFSKSFRNSASMSWSSAWVREELPCRRYWWWRVCRRRVSPRTASGLCAFEGLTRCLMT